MMSRLRYLRPFLVAAGLGLPAALGCSGGDPAGRVAVHPARGRVLYRGKPLADALVVFRPEATAAGPAGAGVPQPTGRTDAEGNFLLHTYLGDDGAPAGPYLVGVTVSPAFSETRNVMRKDAAEPVPRAVADAVAARYADPGRSGLKAEIKPAENAIPAFRLD